MLSAASKHDAHTGRRKGVTSVAKKDESRTDNKRRDRRDKYRLSPVPPGRIAGFRRDAPGEFRRRSHITQAERDCREEENPDPRLTAIST
jgi:hypothetical protein